ncbi:uncharacterized protein ASCRUDRAFT_69816 [Ascoidea rubescens DSM 1968]|uniref:Uncharacterized protein n=1 Tax=Ascoidea rubescens DSM 1968 TaxID=1344418 RepID=A0A1D2VKL9_9ASCO|nr:hypothetical protein ASCRUDRAFT_69816 [Ascoidea rubescens DSM 1968]ODV62135.1 hypothetical protein ASCRUDRAFT_69816 [Ascoidea rubescens DSM 1968]
MYYLKRNQPVPVYLDKVTGDLDREDRAIRSRRKSSKLQSPLTIVKRNRKSNPPDNIPAIQVSSTGDADFTAKLIRDEINKIDSLKYHQLKETTDENELEHDASQSENLMTVEEGNLGKTSVSETSDINIDDRITAIQSNNHTG